MECLNFLKDIFLVIFCEVVACQSRSNRFAVDMSQY